MYFARISSTNKPANQLQTHLQYLANKYNNVQLKDPEQLLKRIEQETERAHHTYKRCTRVKVDVSRERNKAALIRYISVSGLYQIAIHKIAGEFDGEYVFPLPEPEPEPVPAPEPAAKNPDDLIVYDIKTGETRPATPAEIEAALLLNKPQPAAEPPAPTPKPEPAPEPAPESRQKLEVWDDRETKRFKRWLYVDTLRDYLQQRVQKGLVWGVYHTITGDCFLEEFGGTRHQIFM